jgi:hypothetical protein
MGGAVDDRWPRRVAAHLTVVLAQTRNPSQKMARAERRTPSLGVVSALQASMGSVSTLSSCTSAT